MAAIQSSTAQTAGVGGTPPSGASATNISIPGVSDLASAMQSVADQFKTARVQLKSVTDLFGSINTWLATADFLGLGIAGLGVIIVLMSIAPSKEAPAAPAKKEAPAVKEVTSAISEAGEE